MTATSKITSEHETGFPLSRADSPAPKVSVVIACLNESRSIGGCVDAAIRAFQTLGISGEVIVADNGSIDGSIEVAQIHGARVVNAVLRGYGSAIRTGIEAARGDFIITGDADGSHDFGEIGRFIDKLQEGYDFVLGSRLLGNIKSDAMRWHHRRIGTPALSWLVNIFFGVKITDINTGMRGLTRSAAQKLDLRTTGFESCSESLIKAAKAGMRITEVPITTWPEQRDRPPHLRSFRDGWRHLRLIMLSAPNWLFLLPGGLFAALGMAVVLWLLPGPLFAGRVGLNINTISLAMMLILVGVHIFSIGLFVKVFCHTEKLSATQVGLTRWLKHLKLEHGLALGASLFAFGAIGDGIIFRQWAQQGFGYLHPVRWVFFCSLSLFLGIEVTFSSVFLSMLGIARDTFIGE